VRARGLWELSTERLEDLRAALGRAVVGSPVTGAGLDAEGFGAERDSVRELVGLPREHAVALVDALLGDRRHRPPPHLELVWSGPETGGTESRDTAQALKDLFRAAEHSVIVAGFAFHGARHIFEPLHERWLGRELDVQFFIHVTEDAPGMMGAPAFFTYTWPWTDRRPEAYYDARAGGEQGEVKMHAKCVVVDERVTFVTSANFTGRAHRDNVELGVLITDERFARRVAAHWRSLIGPGIFRKLT
jgi:hypothetical protein